MRTIPISNEPITGFARAADNIEFYRNERERVVRIAGEITTMYDGNPYKVSPFFFEANDTFMVNEDGDVVAEGGIRTEYEHYNQYADMPVSLNALIEQAILKLDSNGRFNGAI